MSHPPLGNDLTPAAASPDAQPREIDLTLPLAIVIGALIVAGSVIYAGRTVGSSVSESQKTSAVAAAPAAPAAPTAPAAAQPAAPDPNKRVNVAVGIYPPLGKKDAKVTIVEFSDLQCPFCKRFHDDAFPQLKREYIDTGKVSFSYRQFPLPIHPQAPKAAEAVACANDQGKFWPLVESIFNDQANIQVADLKSKAKALGLNTSTFDACLDSGEKKAEVDKDTADGTSAGVSGTPTFYINGKVLVGAQPFAQFKTVIDQELAS